MKNNEKIKWKKSKAMGKVTASTLVYGWGQNKFSQFGPNIQTSRVLILPELIFEAGHTLDGSTIEHISCTSFGTFYVTKKGNVYSSGLNFMRKPHQHFHNYAIAVKELRDNVKVISSGTNHAVLVTRDDQIYSVGDGYFGLGHPDCSYLSTFKRVHMENQYKYLQVKCGQSHTLLLTECGRVLGFGMSSFGQLAVQQKRVPTPREITIGMNRMIDIDAGYDFSVMIDEMNTAYFVGNNTNELIAGGDNVIVDPWKIELLENNVKSVSAGYANLAILTLDNEVYTAGADHNILLRSNTRHKGLCKIDTSPFGNVKSVVYNSLILSAFIINDNNDVFCVGDLGLLNSTQHITQLELMPIPKEYEVTVATGAKHVLVYAKQTSNTNSKALKNSEAKFKKLLTTADSLSDICIVSV